MMATDQRRDQAPPAPSSSGSRKKKRSGSKERLRLSSSSLPVAVKGNASPSSGPTEPAGEVWEAKHSYDAEPVKEDESHTLLSFKRGQLVLVQKKSATGWWKGRLLNGSDTVGRFPMNFLTEYQGYPQFGRVDVFEPLHSVVHAAVAHTHRLVCSTSTAAWGDSDDDPQRASNGSADAQSAARLLHELAEHMCVPLLERCDGALRQLRDDKLLAKWKAALDTAHRDASSLCVAASQRQRQPAVSAAYRCSESFAHLARLEHESVARLLWRHLTDEELSALRDAHIAAAQPHLAASLAWMDGHPVVYPPTMLAGLHLRAAPVVPTATTRARRRSSADYVLHLIVSFACPWSARALLVRAVCGLERLVSVSVLSPQKTAGGEWAFDVAGRFPGCDPRDTLFDSCTALADVYQITQPPQWNGRATVPMLIDRKTRTCMSNSSLDIVRILGGLGSSSKFSLRPEPIEKRIDPVVANVTAGIRCFFDPAHTAEQKDAHLADYKDMATRVNATLSRHRYLAGAMLSEADILCFGFFMQIDNYLLDAAGFTDGPPIASFANIVDWMSDVAQTNASVLACVSQWPAHIAAFAAADAGRPQQVRIKPLNLSAPRPPPRRFAE